MLTRLLIGLLPTLAGVSSAINTAKACEPSYWDFDRGDLPQCVELMLMMGNESQLEIVNGCSESLTLEAMSCEGCSVPQVVDAGATEAINLDGSPGRDISDDIQWSMGDASGEFVIEYLLNECSSEGGCSLGHPRSSQGWIALTGLLMALAFRKRARR